MSLGTRQEQEEKFKEMARIALKINKYSCTKCFDRGFESWNAELGQYIPCICVVKAARKIELEKRQKKLEVLKEEKPEIIEEKIN